jgi:hypothetical protein
VKGRRRGGVGRPREERRPSRGKEDVLEGETPRVLLWILFVLYFLITSASSALHRVEPLFIDIFTAGPP